MEPVLQTQGASALNALAASQNGAAGSTTDATMQQMFDQGTQQVLGLVLNLVMSQTGEG